MNKYRERFYPYHKHYYEMRLAFRPFVMFVHEPGFVSACVTTDSYGLRHQHIGGSDLDITQLRDTIEICDVLIGGSTAFGVDASGNDKTIAARMSARSPDGIPVVNLGLRGALSEQELISFVTLRHLLPRVRNIYILSGVNVASYAAQPNSLIYEDYGCLFSEEYNYNLVIDQYNRFVSSTPEIRMKKMVEWMESYYRTNKYFRWFCDRFSGIEAERPKLPGKNTAGQLDTLLTWLRRDLNTWKDIANSVQSINFVMQPAIGWTKKPLSSTERTIFDEDRKMIPSLDEYATPEFYAAYLPRIKALCDEAGISFGDANSWFDRPEHSGKNYFTDVCHLNDDGNEAVAQYMAGTRASN